MFSRLQRVFCAAFCLAVLPVLAQTPDGLAGVHPHAVNQTPDALADLLGMGRILAFRGSLDASTVKFREALRVYPTNAEAGTELGLNLMLSGRTNDAARCFSSAMQLDPGLAEQNKITAKALMNSGQMEPARRRLILACCLKPEDVEARLTLALCVQPPDVRTPGKGGMFAAYLARLNAAYYEFEKTLRFRPAVESYVHLGSVFASNGMFFEAMQEYREAVRLYPDNANALDLLAWNLATCPKSDLRDGAGAVPLAVRAIALSRGRQPAFLGTLAAAYAEDGQFDKAVETAKKARELAVSMGQNELAAQNGEWLKLYSARRTISAANGP